MVKLDDLRLDQLKKELGKVNLPTAGTKAELQRRLRDELLNRGIDVVTHEFECKEEMEVTTRSMTSSLDINSMLAAMMEKMEINNKETKTMIAGMETKLQEAAKINQKIDEMETKLQEASKNNNQQMLAEMETKLQEASKINNQQMLAEMKTELKETVRTNNEKLLDQIEGKLSEISGSTNKQLQEISGTINNRIDGVENKFDKKIEDLEAKFNDLQQQESSVRVVQETSSRIKTPSFDGSLPFNVFKFQFETVAEKNLWNNEQKALELIMALKGSAAEVLESVPLSNRKNFDDIMSALQRKYGGEHRKEIQHMELRSRVQKPNETLQDFALDIERLVELIYAGETQNFLDHLKIEAFVNGIRDQDIRYAVLATRKSTFSEALSIALTQETAKIITKSQVCKLRGVNVVDNNQSSMEHLMEAMNRLLEKLDKPKSKCYNCGKEGHFQRNCRAPKKQQRSTSSPDGTQQVEPQSTQGQSLN